MLRLALVVVGALPLLATALAWTDTAAPVARVLDAWFALHCHRDPSRTLEVLGRHLPVCARCTGIYLGMLYGSAYPLPRLPFRVLALAALGCGALLLLDVGTEALGWRVPALGTRFVSGLFFALPLTAAAVRPSQPDARGLQADET